MPIIGSIMPIETAHAATFSMKTGYYMGSGAALSITGLGFEPDLVLLKPSTTAGIGMVAKSSAMPANTTMNIGGATANDTGTIVTLDADGFTLTSSANVNSAGIRWDWVAFSGSDCVSADSTFCVGTYTGDGAVRNVTTGFQPDFVATQTSGQLTAFKTSAMDANETNFFGAKAAHTGGELITTFNATSFGLGAGGTNLNANASGSEYYFFALKEVAGAMDVGEYTGDGAATNTIDATDEAGLTFQSDFMLLKNATNGATYGAIAQFDKDNVSHLFTDTALQTNMVKSQISTGGFTTSSSAYVNQNASKFYYASFGGSAPPNTSGTFDMASGSYTGTGATLSIENLGFEPDLVIIKNTTTNYGVFRTRLMKASGSTAYIGAVTVAVSNGITSLDSGGFTLSTNALVNSTGVVYHYQAFGNAWNPETNSGAADFAIGMYTGSGADSRNIYEVPFNPDFVFIKKYISTTDNTAAVWRTSAMPGDLTNLFSATNATTNEIQSLGTNSFQVGSGSRVNYAAADGIAWFAFKESANFDVGSYTGTGSSQNITGLGFEPDLVWTKKQTGGTTARAAVFLARSLTDGNSQFFINSANAGNLITDLIADGFTVTTGNEANENTYTFDYVAWKNPNEPGITVSAISGDTTEAGGTATFTVVLDTRPNSDVTVDIATDDATEGTASAATLTFTNANWATPQTVTVTGVDDADADGDIAYNIITAASSSSDLDYNGINPSNVAVTNTDDEAPANTAPTANAPNTISQATDGTGYITFETTISDADFNDTKLKVEYSEDGGSTWFDPDLVSATASVGTVDLSDANAYQIGTVDAIDTSGGARTLTIVWDTLSASNGNGSLDTGSQADIKVRVTPNDATEDGAVATSEAFSLDNLDPTISSRVTADLDGDGYIDAMHITFDENVKDISVVGNSFAIAGATGEAFSSTTNSDTANDNDIYITFTDGVLASSSTANVTYTAGSLTDSYGNSLATVGPTASTDGAGPAILSATASDATIPVSGIDADDTVTIVFSENTNQPAISAVNINAALALNNSHVWDDGADAIGSAVWSDAATLLVTLSTGTSAPTIAVGDTITLNGTTITDGTNNSSTTAFSAITGSFTSNSAPTVSISSAAEKTDGTGAVDIAVVVDDADNDDTVRLKVQYKAGGTCDSGNSTSTISETDALTTASNGDPKVENDNEYQVGNGSGWITTSAGANTVNFDWLSDTDVAEANGTYCISITPYDGTEAGTPDTITLTLDNANPTSAGNLALNAATTTSLTLDLGVAGSDTNLSNYKIYYKGAASGVTESDTLHATIASGDYNADGTTTISDLSINTVYTFNIWTYDTYGNESSATELAKYTLANAPTTPTVAAISTSGLNAIIAQNSNPSNTTYAIKVGAQYVQVDGTLGVAEAWQTYAEWGGVAGQNITGLSANTQYTVSVKARNGDNTETAFSDSSAKYTYANPVTDVALANATTNDDYLVTLTWTDASQTGIKIDFATVSGGACDTTYDVGNYDNTIANSSSPRSVSAAANTCYKARILSYNGDGVLNTTDAAVSEGLTTPPAIPANLAKTAADETSISWGWDAVSGATNYKIYRSSDDTYIGQTGDETTAYTQTTSDGAAALTANTQHTVYVRAVNANGEGVGSLTASAYTTADAPVSMSNDGASQTTSTLKWTWLSGGAQKDFYSWMTSPVANSGYIVDLFWLVNGTLSANTQYTGYVKARNEEDTETSEISANAYTSQNAPTGLTYSGVTSSSITVTADGTFPNIAIGSSGIRFQNSTTAADNTFQDDDWTNSSLSPNVEYTYIASALNGDGDETSTVTSSKYTLAAVPGITTVNTPTTSTLNVTLNTNSNSVATEYLIHETGTGLYVQADNTLGAATYWQTNPGTITVTGLSKNTSYEFETKARNGDDLETVYGTASSAYTLVSASSEPTVDGATTTSLNVTINQGTNPVNTTYKIYESTTAQYVQADGTLGESAAWQTGSVWGTVSGVSGKIAVTGLSPDVQYTFNTTARNASNVESAASGSTSLYTLANAPGVTTVDGPSTTTLDVTIAANSNPATTEFKIYESTTEQYVQADGSLGAAAAWQTVAAWGTVSGTSGQIQVSGLSKNTSYTFVVTARNGDDVATAAAAGVSAYSAAAVPLSLTAVIDLTLGTTVTWLTNGNPDGTVYYAENVDTPARNSGWIDGVSWTSSDDKTQGTRYCYRVKSRNEDEVETAWLTLTGDDCAIVEVESESGSSGGGGGGSVPGWIYRINKEIESAKEEPVFIPEDTKITENELVISKKEAESTSEPLQITNSVDRVSLFISESTNITEEGDGLFEGEIKPPSVIVNPTFIPPELSSNLLLAIKIDTSSDKSVYFSQPAVVTISIEDILAKNPDYDPANLVVYFYNHDTGQYEYVSRLTISPNRKQASFLTYHLSTFVVFDVDADEEEMLDDSNPFVDMSGHWAKPYVNRLYDMNVVSGRTYTKFMPNEKVTRAELLKIALLAFKYRIQNLETSGFNDVPVDSWAFSFVSTAMKAGLINGYSDGSFKPDNYINRAEALKILLEAASLDVSKVDINRTTFPDVSTTDWFKPFVDYAAGNGVLSGYIDGTFKPGAYLTRAEAAKLTVKILDLM